MIKQNLLVFNFTISSKCVTKFGEIYNSMRQSSFMDIQVAFNFFSFTVSYEA